MPQFTHLDEKGKARMVDVSEKRTTLREAVARGKVLMKPQTARAIESQTIAKGDVLAVAKIAGVMAAKKTSDLIPLCHPLEITAVDVSFRTDAGRGEIEIEASVRTRGRTGVEMEALTAVSAAALTIYDMCKAADRAMTLSDIRLVLKRGGKSGTFRRKD
ncbi:MAG TPA: cyclic pyranopterin monophosphate synthase MoaC [Syntrophales bacterium]|nr:cyclic pyranopterin monophosphate synthase MoaC [Syntrophales bacterium]